MAASGGSWTGRLHGIEVRSEVPLGWCPAASPGREPDVLVRVGGVSTRIDQPVAGDLLAHWRVPGGRPVISVARRAEGYLIRFHGRVPDLEVTAALDQICCRPGPATPVDDVVPDLTGSGIATMLCLGDHLVLHGSAFALAAGGGAPTAVALLGESGSGKSTLTALACALGAFLVSDDVLRIDDLDAAPRAVAGHGEVRLRPDSAALLRTAAAGLIERETADGRFASRSLAWSLDRARSSEQHLDAVVLGCFLVPQRVASLGRPRLTQLSGLDALLALAKSPRISGWRGRRYLAVHFEGTRVLATKVPVYRVELPAGGNSPLETTRELLGLLEGRLR